MRNDVASSDMVAGMSCFKMRCRLTETHQPSPGGLACSHPGKSKSFSLKKQQSQHLEVGGVAVEWVVRLSDRRSQFSYKQNIAEGM